MPTYTANDIIAVSNYRQVSLEQASVLLQTHSTEDLLKPQSSDSIGGETLYELGQALNNMEDSLPHGGMAELVLCSEEMPTPADLEQFYNDLIALGFHISYPEAEIIDGVPTTTMILRKGSPQWIELIAVLPALFIVGLIAFGIANIAKISSALLPILITVFAGAALVIFLLRQPVEKVATTYIEKGGKIPYLPSTIPTGSTCEQELQPATVEAEPVPDKYRELIQFVDEPLPLTSNLLMPATMPQEGEKKIDLVMKQLKDGVEGIQNSNQFRNFLTTMSKFHDYSIGNLILITLQKPDATHVAGFTTWKDMGRWVKAGAKGIAILAPVMPRKPRQEEIESGEKEEIPVAPIYFRVVYVFDISQTEGKPLPEFDVPVLTGEANEELFTRVLALARKQGLDVNFDSRPQQDPGIKGLYAGKSIWIRPEESRAQQLKSLIHELAHHYSEGVFRIPRKDAETIAESAAYAVGAHFGFDSGTRSFPYVALWSKDKKALQENLAAIRKVVTAILDSLEEKKEQTLMTETVKSYKTGPAAKPGRDPYSGWEYKKGDPVVFAKQIDFKKELPPFLNNSYVLPWAYEEMCEKYEAKPKYVRFITGPQVGSTVELVSWEKEKAGMIKRGEIPPEVEYLPATNMDKIIRGLESSRTDEQQAVDTYRERQKAALQAGDKKTVAVYEHVIGEEIQHKEEFAQRKKEVASGKIDYLADSQTYLTQTIEDTGWRQKINQAFQEAVTRTHK